MIFICDIIIYPLIKKNKFNCVFLSLNIVIVSKNLKKLTNNVSLSNEKKKIYKHSWCVRVRCRTRWNPSRPVETRRNPFRLTRLNPSKHVQTCYVSSRPNELFSIFLFLFYKNQIYTSSPLLPPFFPSPPISPLHPHILFLFLFGGGEGGGRGGERAGDGDGTGGEPPPPPPAGRSVAPPPKGGGTKSPPPSPSNKKNKQNLQIKRHIYSRQ